MKILKDYLQPELKVISVNSDVILASTGNSGWNADDNELPIAPF